MRIAPDWFALRRLVARHAWRMNIIHVAAAVSRTVALTCVPRRQLLRVERSALAGFVAFLGQLMEQRGSALDARTAASLLYGLSRLKAAHNVSGRREVVWWAVLGSSPCLLPSANHSCVVCQSVPVYLTGQGACQG